ncbi:hypothetical protein EA698_19090, partial [Acinetobacter baumannii]|uniref:hypothetical protein n=1 Tax=Acinetobacter baumannii TaxID=470 RepID=UPI000F9F732F
SQELKATSTAIAVTPVTLCLFEKVFTFIIDLAVLQKHIGPGEGRCAFFVVYETNTTLSRN